MTSSEIREDFFRFFEGKGHTRVPSAPVVPQDDPTLLFTNAGMNQFKDVFLGTGRREYTRAVDTQKCIRVSGKHNDLEEVGFSCLHHTFFEMLGNWSFGDYFQREAIAWAWELLTEVWKLPRERLWATVFGGDAALGLELDEEAEKLWTEVTDLPPERVLRFGKEDNFWEMGETGPCGPNSEIHYYLGDDLSAQSAEGVNSDDPNYIEIWNLVFIQFNREEDNHLEPLLDKHVDTGMGFERICSLLQGVRSNYDTDLFQPIIEAIGEITRKPYGDEHRAAMQVIADHIRALTFAIAEGTLPSNEGRGYVLRRILRRASRFGRTLDMHEPFLYRLTSTVADVMGKVFPEILQQAQHVALVVKSEEEGFGKTLDRGIEIFEEVSRKGRILGEDAFRLYDTYGFPLDLTQLMAAEKGLEVDVAGFEREMAVQQTRSREAARTVSQGVVQEGFLPKRHSKFVGYETLSAQAGVVAWRTAGEGILDLYLDVTPFYAEAGGQVGDRGRISNDDVVFQVEDTFRVGEGIVHRGRLMQGELEDLTDARVKAEVNGEQRLDTARNHTATHLVHDALRRVLGRHVQQAGSLVAPDRLRFDFTHFTGVETGQMEEVEGIVNDVTRRDLAVEVSYAELEAAKEMGATMLFTAKYGDVVRVVRVGDFSLELCGGTHVQSTGQIGILRLVAEAGVAAGVRRIEALTGRGMERVLRRERTTLAELEGLLDAQMPDLPGRVSDLLSRNRELERELLDLRRKTAGAAMDDLVHGALEVDGTWVVAAEVEIVDMASFRDMADGLRAALGSGVGVLGTNLDGKASLIAVVSDDLIRRGVQAGAVVKEVARVVGGGGGGRPHMAQAGGRHPEKINQALALVPEIVRAQLGG